MEQALAALLSNSSIFTSYSFSRSVLNSLVDSCDRREPRAVLEELDSLGLGEVGAVSSPWTIFHVRSALRNFVRVVDHSE
jgi:hypothetical protein